MSNNTNLQVAKGAKNDEFYTKLSDIERELKYYVHHFRDKTVYCNCDDPEKSAFWTYFHRSFSLLGLKKLVSTHYVVGGNAYRMEYDGGDDSDVEVGVKTYLQGDGDFRSDECVETLKQSDVVVTNPPFSLFREFVALLFRLDKKFLVIGSKNAITYRDFFPYMKDNRVWVGYHNVHEFVQPDGSVKEFGNIGWYTNLDVPKRYEPILCWRVYHPDIYPKYDNYDAIEVSHVSKIPCNYWGVMGVPVTYMDKHNPEQFEIIGATESEGKGFSNGLWDEGSGVAQPLVGGQRKYKRIFIRRVPSDSEGGARG